MLPYRHPSPLSSSFINLLLQLLVVITFDSFNYSWIIIQLYFACFLLSILSTIVLMLHYALFNFEIFTICEIWNPTLFFWWTKCLLKHAFFWMDMFCVKNVYSHFSKRRVYDLCKFFKWMNRMSDLLKQSKTKHSLWCPMMIEVCASCKFDDKWWQWQCLRRSIGSKLG